MTALVLQFPKSARKEPASPCAVLDLSFVALRKPKGSGIEYWTIRSAGDYSSDRLTGEKLAKEYIAYIGRNPTHGNQTLLGCIVNDMVQANNSTGRIGAIEMAFLEAVNGYAMALAASLARTA